MLTSLSPQSILRVSCRRFLLVPGELSTDRRFLFTVVYGPALQPVSSLDALNTSSAGVYDLMKKDGSSVKAGVPETPFPVFADVRNVGKAHYEAIARGKNGRFIICSGVSSGNCCKLEVLFAYL